MDLSKIYSVGDADGLGEGGSVGDANGIGNNVGLSSKPDTRKCIKCELGKMLYILIPVKSTLPFW